MFVCFKWDSNPFAQLATIPELENDGIRPKYIQKADLIRDKASGEANHEVPNEELECLKPFQTDLPRNLSVIPAHLLMNKKKVKPNDPGRGNSDDPNGGRWQWNALNKASFEYI